MLVISLFNGLTYGSLLLITASGLALIYGLRRVVNFAHGALYMLGAYIGYSIALYTNFWIAFFVSPLIMAAVGVCLDKMIFRPLQDREPLSVLLVTFGLLLIIGDIVHVGWGRGYLSVATPELLDDTIPIFGMPTPVYRIAIVLLGALVVLGLVCLFRFTRIGLFARAASTDPVATAMQGVNTDQVSAIIVGLGTALAALAGVASAPLYPLTPTMGGEILVSSFVVVVIGGLGSLWGAFVAAIVLGLVNSFGILYLPNISVVLPFLLMVIILIWKPTGLAGSRVE